MKKAIITGANGFIGSAVVRELLKQDVEVLALSHNGNSKNITKDKRCVQVAFSLDSMESLSDSLQDSGADIFYHFAWAGSAGTARTDTALQLNNVQWTIDALRTAHALGCKRFVCAGSIMENETMAAAYTQGNQPGLAYIYGGAKVTAHIMCMSVAASLGIELVWPKITNAYGVGEKSPRLVNTTIAKIMRRESPQFTSGTQMYDFVYIDDVANAFYLIGERGKPFHEYLIGSGTARPLREFLLEMKGAIAPGLDFLFGDIPFTGIDLPLEKFDCSSTEHDTGFRAKVTFADGVSRTMGWLKEETEGNDKV